MSKKIPELEFEDWMNDAQKEILIKAYEKVKDIFESTETEGELDFYTLINYAYDSEKELQLMELDILKAVVNDQEKMNTKWLKANPKILDILNKYDPEAIKKVEAIEMTTDMLQKQRKYENRKYLYIIFASLLGIALFPFWGGVVGFLVGYGIRYYFQPIKVVMRLLDKKED